MNVKVSAENQQLQFMKEDIVLKRKFSERVVAADQEFLELARKNSRVMEDMSNSITQFLQAMTAMMYAQVPQQPPATAYPHAPVSGVAMPKYGAIYSASS